MGVYELFPDRVHGNGEIRAAIRDIIIFIRHRYHTNGKLLLFLHRLVMLRHKVFQQAPQAPLVVIGRLNGILQIRQRRFARPSMGVIEIAAIIQGPALEYRLIAFLADNDRGHGPDRIEIRVVVWRGKRQAVDVLRILLDLCFRHRQLGQVGMVKQCAVHIDTEQSHRRPSRYRKVTVPVPATDRVFLPACNSSSGNSHVPALTDF